MGLPNNRASYSDQSQKSVLRVWRDPSAAGGLNMAADEALARRSEETNSVLMRLYGWQPHTVSLGCFQKIDDFSRASFLAHWPVVRRPSGGGAIIHGTDVTYGLAVPSSHNWSKRTEDLYSAVHGALVQELNDRDLKARMVEVVRREQEQNFYCFNRRAFGDLVVEHPIASSDCGNCKILGSAQRRLSCVVLQHGTLLLRRNPQIQGEGSHPGLEDLLQSEAGSVGDVIEGWLQRLADQLGGELIQEAGFSYSKNNGDIMTRTKRYETATWLNRR
ncbi:MAG: hypothetical protein HON07_00575 [Planctomycetaceae bacterium]|nr:hypothetical protein [Planctomycetaceae bacterium]